MDLGFLKRRTAIFLVGLVLVSCGGPGPFTKPLRNTYVKDGGVAAPANQAGAPEAPPPSQPPLQTVVQGTGEFLAIGEAKGEAATDEDGITLNFADADVREVLQVLLGDVLGLNFVVDPAIEGKVTLQSSRPVPKSDVYPLLEEALALNGLAITESRGVYSAVKFENAQRRTKALRASPGSGLNPRGYGIWAVPLKYISAVEMQKILEPFAPAGNIVRVDSARNLLLVSGGQQEISTLLETIATFDVDWMKGMSFGLYELTHVDAETVAGEIKEIFNAPGSPVQDMVRFIPLPRLNALLVMSPRQEYLSQAEEWVTRLDRGRDKVSRRIYVYYVQNGKADDLVSSLAGILGTDDSSRSGGGGDTDSPSSGAGRRSNQDRADEGFSLSGSERSSIGGSSSTRNRGTLDRRGGSAASDLSSEIALSDAADSKPEAFESNGARFVADNKNNAILIYATSSEFDLVNGALLQLDSPPLQVLIEATIIEVGLSKDLSFGVEWFFKEGKNSIDLSATGIPTAVFPGFSYLFAGTDMKIVVNALSSVTDVNVISSPQLMVVNNETARLQVGDEVPVPTQSAVSVQDPDSPIVNSIEFKDSGVILVVTPRINNNGSVYMEVTQEVSDVVPNVSSGIDAPTFQQRKITSTVVIDDGQTIALGGLIRENKTRTKSGVPFLKDIPLLGLPFRQTDNSKRRTELLMFITPHVIRSNKDAKALSDYLRLRLDEEHRKGLFGIKFKPPVLEKPKEPK